MRKKLTNIALLSAVITTIGFLMDGDLKEPSMLMRFVEYFAIVALIFILVCLVYFSALLTIKHLGKFTD